MLQGYYADNISRLELTFSFDDTDAWWEVLKAPLLEELEVVVHSVVHSLTGSRASSVESCRLPSCPPAYQADTWHAFRNILDFSVESFTYALTSVYAWSLICHPRTLPFMCCPPMSHHRHSKYMLLHLTVEIKGFQELLIHVFYFNLWHKNMYECGWSLQISAVVSDQASCVLWGFMRKTCHNNNIAALAQNKHIVVIFNSSCI